MCMEQPSYVVLSFSSAIACKVSPNRDRLRASLFSSIQDFGLSQTVLATVAPVMAQNAPVRYTCNDLASQFEANLLYAGNRAFYQAALDADSDGLACEHLPVIYSRGTATRVSSGSSGRRWNYEIYRAPEGGGYYLLVVDQAQQLTFTSVTWPTQQATLDHFRRLMVSAPHNL